MKRETYPTLTPAELKALTAFAAYAGRTWKQELRDAWMTASMPGHLHSLRNSHGPAWLNQFQFPTDRYKVTFYGPAQAQKTAHYMDGTRAEVQAWADREGVANGHTEWVIRRDAVRITI